MAGKIIADTIETGAGADISTSYVVNGSAKAWVNFNGTGTIATRDSFNVSSLGDDGVGLYNYNTISALNNSNYKCGSNGGSTGIATTIRNTASIPSTSSQALIGMRNTSNVATDAENMHGDLHGDLA